MEFLNEIKTETLVISNTNIKDIYMSLNCLKPVKFMTLNTFLGEYYFSYDEKTITYVMKKYNIKYDIAKEYLDNLLYLEDKTYEVSKLDFLVNIKRELADNNLLIYNDYFKDYLKRIKIILYDIDMDEFLTSTLNGYNYEVINRTYNKYPHQVLEFKTMDEEINYMAREISKLINEGIALDKIKLTNISDNYYNSIARIFGLYNLKVNIPYKTKLASYKLVKVFLEKYQRSSDIEESLKDLDDGSVIYHELIDVINKYHKYEDKELLIYKIENTSITASKYNQGIDIIDYMNYLVQDDEYIFMLNFNEGSIPRNTLDVAYITDNICPLVGLNTTVTKNKITKDKTLGIISDIKNLVITYKMKDFKDKYYPSNLCSYFEVITPEIDNTISYSEIFDKMSLVKAYDDYFKYGYLSDNFDLLNSNYEINYNSYDNKYHKIDRIMEYLNLSYSKMNDYNKCAFKYYIKYVLKLDIFEENFSTTIGSMVHYVMEHVLKNNDNDLDKYISEYLKDISLTKKEAFFINKYRDSIKELLAEIKLESEYSLFKDALYEQEIEIDYGDNIHFKGIIDKVLYHEKDGNTYMALVDYKTGNDNITLAYLKYGIDIQLPIYLYLSTRLPFKNKKYVGFYLQKLDIKEKDYRLIGYSNSDKDTLSIIDKDYDKSKIIKGIKINKDGNFAKTSRVLSDDEIESLKTDTEDIIMKTITKIKDNEFTINPKVTTNKNIGCEYCKFIDLCFKQKKDEIEILNE